jgi:hypothetical protein
LGNQGGAPLTYTEVWLQEEARLFYDWMKEEDSLYFKSFAIHRGYSPQRLSEFAEKSPEFSEALEFAKAWQEQKLINLGLWNKLNSSMTKFVLSNCHSWREQTQFSGDAVNPLAFLLRKIDGNSKELINGSSFSS